MHSIFDIERYLEGLQWPATRMEVVEWMIHRGAPKQVVEEFLDLDLDDEEEFHSIDEMWEGMPRLTDYFVDEDED